MQNFEIINPYNLSTILTKPYDELAKGQEIANILNENFKIWKKLKIQERAKIIDNFQKFLTENIDELAGIISQDIGKPIIEAEMEIKKSIACCKFYSDNIDKITAKIKMHNSSKLEPSGVILGIMPWNFPLWQIIRFIIPTLISGNLTLVKPSYNAYRIAKFINRFFCQTSLKIFDIVMLSNQDTEKLISDQNIAAISLTGSVKAGEKVAAIAGENLKNSVLELGGSDPFIVFNDANLKISMINAVKARFLNNGQTCIAAKRFFFQQDIFNDSIELFKKNIVRQLKFGDPLVKTTTIGPLARKDLFDNLNDQLKRANIQQSQIIYQGEITNNGYHFPPMLIDGRKLSEDNPLKKEEVFGPVAVCFDFNDIEDVITKANNSDYGLGASVWTNNQANIDKMINSIDAGIIAINKLVISDFDNVFGGRKKSGLGIELGIEGALSFMRYKTII